MSTKIIAFIIIIAGIIMVAYTGFNYITTEKVVDIGPVQISKEKNNPVQWSPIVGGVLIAGGIILLISSKKTTA
jgi:hypothetical protein